MKTVLVPIDFSDATEPVIDVAKEMNAAFGGKIVFLHVSEAEPVFIGYEPGPESVREAVAEQFKAEHSNLHAVKARFDGSGKEVVALHVQGPPAEKIVEEASRLKADLIVVGSHGHGALYHLLAGSVTSGILKHAPCPVLVVPVRK
jgi:nucleotide-binding universal stress UspA family protein